MLGSEPVEALLLRNPQRLRLCAEFYGYCTLATCKPEIRKRANVNDIVIGTGSKSKGRRGMLVYSMQITEILTFNQYWNDERFKEKKPYLLGSKKQAYGDNIYFCDRGSWHQENSHHSLPNGVPNPSNVEHDTRVDRVLISTQFQYWGGSGPMIPEQFRDALCKSGPGHKCKFDTSFINVVRDWIDSLPEPDLIARPMDWK